MGNISASRQKFDPSEKARVSGHTNAKMITMNKRAFFSKLLLLPIIGKIIPDVWKQRQKQPLDIKEIISMLRALKRHRARNVDGDCQLEPWQMQVFDGDGSIVVSGLRRSSKSPMRDISKT